MGVPQVLIIILMAAGLLISANQHGQVKTKKENFWVIFVSYIIQIGILYWGGFFS